MRFINVKFDRDSFTIFLKSNCQNNIDVKVVVSDLVLDCVYYEYDIILTPDYDGWVIPFNQKIMEFIKVNKDFPGFLIKVYDKNKRLIQVEKIVVNIPKTLPVKSYITPDFDITGPSYVDFFYGDLCKGIDTSGIVVDAGANVGFFTLYAKQGNPKRIYSIEPDPLPYFYLTKNFGQDKEVFLLNKALSDVEDIVSFDISLGASVGSSMSKYASNDNRQTISVESLSIKNILKIEDKIDLLKLDIEGAEFDVLRSMTEDQFNRVDQIFLEFHADSKELELILKQNGYEVEYRHSDRNSVVGFIYAKKL